MGLVASPERRHPQHPSKEIGRKVCSNLDTEYEGITIGPESAACIGAAEKLHESGWLTPHERVVIFSCGGAKKTPELIRADLPRIDKNNLPDWSSF